MPGASGSRTTAAAGLALRSRWWPVLLGGSVALLFGALTSLNLGAQGLAYDEVHQAVAAFDFRHPEQNPAVFNTLQIGALPVLNMSYSGALKTNLYSLFLALGGSFSVVSWRALGIALVAAGLLGFCTLAGRWIPRLALGGFFLLLLTDTTVLLTSRHDWGPTALGLALRLFLLGIWLHRDLGPPPRAGHDFLLGLVVGVAIFEKLNAVVLLAPLGLLLLLRPRAYPWRRSLLAGSAGLGVGSLPLIGTNAWTYFHGHGLVSLAEVSDPTRPALPTLATWPQFAADYLALGQGQVVREWILGDRFFAAGAGLEIAALALGSLILVYCVVRHWRTAPLLRLAGISLACYATVGAGLLLLPRTTWVHHWISGTPFQYLALGLAGAALLQPRHTTPPPTDGGRPWRRLGALGRAGIAIGAVVLLRGPSLLSVEHALLAGQSGPAFDPVFTQIGEFAGRQAATAAFVAADWGLGSQLYCLANGRPQTVYEPFWKTRASHGTPALLDASGKPTVYLLTRRAPALFPENTAAIVAGMTTAPDWQEVPAEAALQDLPLLQVRKFIRRAPP